MCDDSPPFPLSFSLSLSATIVMGPTSSNVRNAVYCEDCDKIFYSSGDVAKHEKAGVRVLTFISLLTSLTTPCST